jgi:hypothetical protein
MNKEIKNRVQIKEPTFLSPLDIHFRMVSGNQRDSAYRYTVRELYQIRDSLTKYGEEEYTAKKVR